MSLKKSLYPSLFLFVIASLGAIPQVFAESSAEHLRPRPSPSAIAARLVEPHPSESPRLSEPTRSNAYPEEPDTRLDGREWTKKRRPAQGKSEAIGNYSFGCLRGAKSLPWNGKGYQTMRLSRRRYFGHPHLISFIQELGDQTSKEKLGTLLIGDLGLPRGGWMKSGHASHQSGLDVDIWFWQPPWGDKRILTARERERLGAPSLVPIRFAKELSRSHWNVRVSRILELAANHPQVERIFVNPAIKVELCRTDSQSAWIRKIRPWWGHDEHFHVRLKCPADSPMCSSQESLSAFGNGCDSTLEWWFSEEAKEELKKPKAKKGYPKIPLGCLSVLDSK